jgi:hypothetical protein
MRAKEFISEQEYERAGDNPHNVPKQIPGGYIIPDSSNNFYQMYRYGIMMARAPDPQPDAFDDQSNLGDKLIVVPYSDGGLETMMAASKALGMPPVSISDYSMESEPDLFRNKVSPVAKFKPTKRPKRS